MMLNNITHAKGNGFLVICKKVQSDPYVLFLVMAAMFFDRSKIPTPVLCRISQETFKPSLVQIGQVVSEEKSFEKLLTTTTDDNDKQRRRTTTTTTMDAK